MNERTCESCRHNWRGLCTTDQTDRGTPEFNREDENDCGPSGRYWKPKESEE